MKLNCCNTFNLLVETCFLKTFAMGELFCLWAPLWLPWQDYLHVGPFAFHLYVNGNHTFTETPDEAPLGAIWSSIYLYVAQGHIDRWKRSEIELTSTFQWPFDHWATTLPPAPQSPGGVHVDVSLTCTTDPKIVPDQVYCPMAQWIRRILAAHCWPTQDYAVGFNAVGPKHWTQNTTKQHSF